MTWKVSNVVSQRIEFVVKAMSKKESVTELCRQYGISRQTGHLWVKRYREFGTFAALEDRSRAAVHVWNRSEGKIEELVLQIRRQDGWAGRKIQQILEREHGIRISARTVDRILKREGCISNEEFNRPALKRFEREAPNELWQMDFKGQYRTREGFCYPLTILDDHSRYVVGLYALKGTAMEGVRDSLIQTFQSYGLPEQLLMDHGTPWWNVNSPEAGLTQIGVMLIKQGVKLCHSGIGHPQTQGKVERFHKTMARSLRYRGEPQRFNDWQASLDRIRDSYNYCRPHESLNMEVPAQRYTSSCRVYQSQPAEWAYSKEWTVIRLNGSGNLQYGGRQYFVSKALRNETVAFRAVEAKLLVRFLNSYVREIDLARHESYALLAEVTQPPVQTAAGVENNKSCFPHLLESNDSQFAQAQLKRS
jgi:transposase InsO family protein